MVALPKPKRLTVSDVESKLCIPKEWWDIIRLLLGEEDDHRREVELWATDGMGMFWEFKCSVRQKGRYKKPVFQSDGWLQFANYKGLNAGDMVLLEPIGNHFRGTRFMLRAFKYDVVGHYWFEV